MGDNDFEMLLGVIMLGVFSLVIIGILASPFNEKEIFSKECQEKYDLVFIDGENSYYLMEGETELTYGLMPPTLRDPNYKIHRCIRYYLDRDGLRKGEI